MILKPPATMKGTENPIMSGFIVIKIPRKHRPKVRPIDRAMFVIPFTAERSSGVTIRVMKVCLAGTSI